MKANKQLLIIFGAIIIAVAFGLFCKNLLPEDICKFISKGICGTCSTIFLNAIKLVVVPVVFFSIATSITNSSGMSTLGKIGGLTIVLFLAYSVFALFLGYWGYQAFPVGSPDMTYMLDENSTNTTEVASKTVADILIGIVPSNIIQAFADANMLQIIFIAALVGVAVVLLKDKGKVFVGPFNHLNTLFIKITNIVIMFMPIAIFCALAKTTIELDFTYFTTMGKYVGLIYLLDIIMFVIYFASLGIFGRYNPIKFIKHFLPAMLTGFSLCSSTAAMPISMDICDKKLNIDKEVYSITIPLGCTINMNGSCITQMVTMLFMASILSVDLNIGTIFIMGATILMLAMGAPGIPGGALVCITMLLPQIGISADAANLILPIYPLISMMQTMTNMTGDAIVSVMVARFFKMIKH